MTSVLWFRRGLRLHDNPALLSALENSKGFLALFIFDTTFQDPQYKPYHSNGFLLECLQDLNESLEKVGTKIHTCMGCPLEIFRYLHKHHAVRKLCFIQDSEPIWHERDTSVKNLCLELDIEVVEHVAHTLWDPMDIIASNGGTPPLTYEMFVHAAMSVGDPSKPVADADWKDVEFLTLETCKNYNFTLFETLPTLKDIGVPENPVTHQKRKIIGGETTALKALASRLRLEETAFRNGFYQPNQARPNLLGPPMSMSAAISVGALSVRLFYWKIHGIFNQVNQGRPPSWIAITGQLIWREYFYTMSRMNPNYSLMANNPICLQIPWNEDEKLFEKWKNGMTGYPFIDAGIRQLCQEGWIHHTVRNAVAMFVTRGDLWLNWDKGADFMASQLVDSDWSVNSGNWMWVSSSAFERLLDCSVCIDSVLYGKRLEPSGEYIRRYVPELANFEFKYIHEPWKASVETQRLANCIIGKDYPERIVNHELVSLRNQQWMKDFRKNFEQTPPHCQPSSESEVFKFFCLSDNLPY